MKEVHRLVPYCDFGARVVPSHSPGVRLTFYQDRGAVAAEIKFSWPLERADPNRHSELPSQDYALCQEELARPIPKFSPSVCVADRANALEVIRVHDDPPDLACPHCCL